MWSDLKFQVFRNYCALIVGYWVSWSVTKRLYLIDFINTDANCFFTISRCPAHLNRRSVKRKIWNIWAAWARLPAMVSYKTIINLIWLRKFVSMIVTLSRWNSLSNLLSRYFPPHRDLCGWNPSTWHASECLSKKDIHISSRSKSPVPPVSSRPVFPPSHPVPSKVIYIITTAKLEKLCPCIVRA